VGKQCPPKTEAIGQFALSFEGQHDAGECVQTFADAGPSKFTADDGGLHPSTLCFGTASDGGPQLWLAVPGNSPRSSDLLPGGGFHFFGSAPGTSGICGSCLIAVDESFDGVLLTSGDGGLALQDDGGLPPITGLSGTLTDSLTNQGGGACVTNTDAGTGCNTPCLDAYNVKGTPF
jgi:hypothetical protein